MEVTDLNDILNVRAIKMENSENGFEDATESVEMSDSLSNIIPQFVAESDLGLMQSSSEIFQTPLAMFDTADDEDTMQSNDSGEEVIVQLMDIRTRLSKLRNILEQRLGVDLSDYTFWLQDAKMSSNEHVGGKRVESSAPELPYTRSGALPSFGSTTLLPRTIALSRRVRWTTVRKSCLDCDNAMETSVIS